MRHNYTTYMSKPNTKTINLQVKIDQRDKEQAEAVAQEAGFDNLAAAVRFIVKHLGRGEIRKVISPFRREITVEQEKEYQRIFEEMQEDVKNGRGPKPVSSVEELFEALEEDEE